MTDGTNITDGPGLPEAVVTKPTEKDKPGYPNITFGPGMMRKPEVVVHEGSNRLSPNLLDESIDDQPNQVSDQLNQVGDMNFFLYRGDTPSRALKKLQDLGLRPIKDGFLPLDNAALITTEPIPK
jgi:hypothetical protein